MKIKAIAFDKDGTLMDYNAFWGPVAEQTARKAMALRGYSAEKIESSVELLGGNAGVRELLFHASYADLTKRFNAAMQSLDGGFAPFDTKALEAVFKSCVPYGEISPCCENTLEIFERLLQYDFKIVLVTQDNEQNSLNCLRALNIDRFFNKIYGDDGIHPTKPDPYYMTELCRDFGIDPREVLMVGDMPSDMLFAKDGGAIAVGVAPTPKAREVLTPISDYIIDDISEIFRIIEM